MKHSFKNTGASHGIKCVILVLGLVASTSPVRAEKLDDAEWHVQGDLPAGLPESAGSIHIRAYLAWAITRNLVSQEFKAANQNLVRSTLRKRWLSDGDLGRCCDGKLSSTDLKAETEAFSLKYNSGTLPLYLKDYHDLAKGLPSDYHAPDKPRWFERVARMIDERYEQWKRKGRIP